MSEAKFLMISELSLPDAHHGASNTEMTFFFFLPLSDSSKSFNIGHDYIKYKLGVLRGKTVISNCIKKRK